MFLSISRAKAPSILNENFELEPVVIAPATPIVFISCTNSEFMVKALIFSKVEPEISAFTVCSSKSILPAIAAPIENLSLFPELV